MHEAMEKENGATFRRMQIRVQLSHASTGESSGRERRPGQGKCFNCQGYGHWYNKFSIFINLIFQMITSNFFIHLF